MPETIFEPWTVERLLVERARRRLGGRSVWMSFHHPKKRRLVAYWTNRPMDLKPWVIFAGKRKFRTCAMAELVARLNETQAFLCEDP